MRRKIQLVAGTDSTVLILGESGTGKELVERFLGAAAARFGRRVPRIAPAILRQLQQHHRPGNVRELQHVVERALLMSAGATPPSCWE